MLVFHSLFTGWRIIHHYPTVLCKDRALIRKTVDMLFISQLHFKMRLVNNICMYSQLGDHSLPVYQSKQIVSKQ